MRGTASCIVRTVYARTTVALNARIYIYLFSTVFGNKFSTLVPKVYPVQPEEMQIQTTPRNCVLHGPPPPPGWKSLHAPSRCCRDARVYGHATTTMHDIEHTPSPPDPPSGRRIETLGVFQKSDTRQLVKAWSWNRASARGFLGSSTIRNAANFRAICLVELD